MLKKLFSPYVIIYSFIFLTTVFFFIGASLNQGFYPEASKAFCIIFSAFMMIVSLTLIGGHFFLDTFGCWPFALIGAYLLYCTYWKMLYPTVVPYNGDISLLFFYWAIFALCAYMALQHLLGLRDAFFSELGWLLLWVIIACCFYIGNVWSDVNGLHFYVIPKYAYLIGTVLLGLAMIPVFRSLDD